MKTEEKINVKFRYIEKSKENLWKLKQSRQRDFNDGWFDALKWVLDKEE